ncbi:MAG: class I SAM-dependent methyltransferase [Candidatus Hodarchaeota archaeon]
MSQNQDEKEITVQDQMKKFLIKGFYGFNTILIYGLGKKLGILDYFYEKGKRLSESGPISSISFTPDELTENLSLDADYVDSLIHLAIECGIFEIENAEERTLITAPHVYNLLINEDHMFYVGSIMSLFYKFAPYQDLIIEHFKTGKQIEDSEISEEFYIDGHKNSANWGNIIEGLFSKSFKDMYRKVRKQGKILEVGCGYGFNLKNWAEKYKRAQFVGIDIDSRAIAYTKNLIEQHKLNDRVDIFDLPIDEFAKSSNEKFDLILLNHVLHEMDHDEEYRRGVLRDLYSLLKDDGLLIVGETMIPDTFSPTKGFQLFDIMHKLLETKFAKFYNEKTFKEFIDSTPFKHAEFIRERGTYFWALKKE